MAAWQFEVCLIPKSWSDLSRKGVSSFYDTEGNYDVSFAWKNIITNDVRGEIIKYYPLSKSWHKDLINFGYEERTDAQIWYEKDELENIQFRIDMRGNFILDIKQVVDIAKKLSCVFFIPSQKCIVEANVFEIISYAKKSNAYLFAKHPDK